MSRKQELIDLIALKWEAWEFWNDLKCKVKGIPDILARKEAEVKLLHDELIIIRRDGEPMEKTKIVQYGAWATITREEYSTEIKEETLSLMKRAIIDDIGYEGLSDWQIIERDQIVLMDKEGVAIQGSLSSFLRVGMIVPGEAEPCVQLGLKVLKEVNIL